MTSVKSKEMSAALEGRKSPHRNRVPGPSDGVMVHASQESGLWRMAAPSM